MIKIQNKPKLLAIHQKMSDPEHKIGEEVGTFHTKVPMFGYTRLYCHCLSSWFRLPAVATLEIPAGARIWVKRDEKYRTEVPSEQLLTNKAKIEKIEPIGYFDPRKCFCFAETGTDEDYKTGKYMTSEYYTFLSHKMEGIPFVMNKKKAEKPE